MHLDDDELSALIRQHATRHAAPSSLRAGLRTQMALAEASRSAVPTSAPTSARAAAPPRRRRFGLGALPVGWRVAPLSFALGMLCMLLVMPWVQRLATNEPLDAELVAEHVRALRAGPLTQVLSSDRHTVKPWFQGRLDYAPPVLDLASDGFPLLGGRVGQLRGTAVATLTYTRNRHLLDVFIWPSAAQQLPVLGLHRGFSVVHWADGSMQYVAVADLDRSEIERFARLWQERSSAQ
jgi:anti-sigma factor RsiW